MFRFSFLLYGLLLPLTTLHVFGQMSNEDSTHAGSLNTAKVRYHFFNEPEQYSIDTTVNNLQLYNPAIACNPLLNHTLGNLGSPSFNANALLHPDFGFTADMISMRPYRLSLQDLKIYTDNKIYTELFYVMGLKSESMLQATHSQWLLKNWQVGFTYSYLNSAGIYLNQKTNHQNFALHTTYTTKQENYSITAAFLYNRLKWEENGGTTDDSVFQKNYISKNVVPVNFNEAHHRWKEDNYVVQQSYFLGTRLSKHVNDTVTVTKFIRQIQLRHLFSISHHYSYYSHKDADSASYLPGSFSFGGIDSVTNRFNFHIIHNEIGFDFLGNKRERPDKIILPDDSLDKNLLIGGASFFYDFIQLYGNHLSNNLFNSGINSYLATNPKTNRRISGSFEANYVLQGYNAQDYLTLGNSNYLLSKKMGTIGFTISQQQARPNFQQQFFYSEIISWQNNFSAQQFTNVSADYLNASYRLKVSVGERVINHFIYMDSLARPAQMKATLTVPYVSLANEFRIGKIHLHQQVLWMSQTPKELMLPNLSLFANWYYENYIFKRAMLVQAGINAWYNTAYYAPNYSPLSGTFYIQDRILYNNLPNIDLFLNAKIKRARLFVKVSNLYPGLTGNNNFVAHGYPTNDLTFKFGVSWRFFD